MRTRERLSSYLTAFSVLTSTLPSPTWIKPVYPMLHFELPQATAQNDMYILSHVEIDNLKIENQAVVFLPQTLETAVTATSAADIETKSEVGVVDTPEKIEQIEMKQIPDVEAPEYLKPLFEVWANAFGVDVNLLKGIAKCESHHNPGAANGPYGGMFQFSTSTWESTRNSMAHDPNPDLRFDPEEAIKTAAFKIASGGIRAWANCAAKFER